MTSQPTTKSHRLNSAPPRRTLAATNRQLHLNISILQLATPPCPFAKHPLLTITLFSTSPISFPINPSNRSNSHEEPLSQSHKDLPITQYQHGSSPTRYKTCPIASGTCLFSYMFAIKSCLNSSVDVTDGTSNLNHDLSPQWFYILVIAQ